MAEANSPDQCEFSVTLSNILDVMGYSYTQIKNGQNVAQYMEDLVNKECDVEGCSVFLAGSKKEGVSFQDFNGDLDIMYIFNQMRCFQLNDSARRSHVDGTAYLLQYEGCPPGYTMLEVDEHSKDDNETVYIRIAKTNKRYVSSDVFSNLISMMLLHGMNKKQDTVHRGPLPTKPSIAQVRYFLARIEQFGQKTKQRLNTTQQEHELALKHIFVNPDRAMCQTNEETQKPQKRDAPDELRQPVEIIYTRKELPDQSKPTSDISVKQEGPLPSDKFDSGACTYLPNTDVDDEGSIPRVSSQAKNSRPDSLDLESFVSKDGSQASLFESVSRTGPSQAAEYKHPLASFLSQDNVVSLPAFCPDYMHQWSSRNRYHNFPTVEQIERISKMEAHVVAVGCKETPNADLQWRICFTMGEVELIQSLNGIQLKMYVLLKMLAKNVIKPECPGIITSYVMKNVVLWMAELKPGDHFREENLESCLIEAVHFLRLCVRDGFLPNYMIHSRNLLQGRLSLQDRGILLKLLGTLVEEKGKMVMRCEKVKHHINSPYISKFFKHTGEYTQMCTDIFRMFLEPALQWNLTDMESVLAGFLISVEKGFDKQATVVKFQSLVLMKYIESWITELSDKLQERVEKRAFLRSKCGELKQRLAMSVALDLIGDPNYRSILKLVVSFQVDVSKVSDEQMVSFVSRDSFLEGLADSMLKTADYLGTLDDQKLLDLLSNPKQMLLTMSGAQRMGEKYAREQRQYSDLDLD